MEIFTHYGFEVLTRWLHVLFGIAWIGMLYYFNFCNTEFFKQAEQNAKIEAQQKLLPLALWWFRWAAMFTFLTGLLLLVFIYPRWNVYMAFGALLGTLMWANVWFRIWPMQQIVIANATAVAQGGEALPNVAEATAKGGLASRTNTLFSVPMTFFMVSSAHLQGKGADILGSNASITAIILGVLAILALEVNAIIGKTGPMTTIRGVITSGFVFTLLLYLIADLL